MWQPSGENANIPQALPKQKFIKHQRPYNTTFNHLRDAMYYANNQSAKLLLYAKQENIAFGIFFDYLQQLQMKPLVLFEVPFVTMLLFRVAVPKLS